MQAEAAKCAFVHVTAAAELGNGQNEANRYSGWLSIAATLVTNRDAGAIAGVAQFAERDPSKVDVASSSLVSGPAFTA